MLGVQICRSVLRELRKSIACRRELSDVLELLSFNAASIVGSKSEPQLLSALANVVTSCARLSSVEGSTKSGGGSLSKGFWLIKRLQTLRGDAAEGLVHYMRSGSFPFCDEFVGSSYEKLLPEIRSTTKAVDDHIDLEASAVCLCNSPDAMRFAVELRLMWKSPLGKDDAATDADGEPIVSPEPPPPEAVDAKLDEAPTAFRRLQLIETTLSAVNTLDSNGRLFELCGEFPICDRHLVYPLPPSAMAMQNRVRHSRGVSRDSAGDSSPCVKVFSVVVPFDGPAILKGRLSYCIRSDSDGEHLASLTDDEVTIHAKEADLQTISFGPIKLDPEVVAWEVATAEPVTRRFTSAM